MTAITLTVNGKEVSADPEPRQLLSKFLREDLGLTGTHIGCDTSQCGVCVVHVDGRAVKSCTMLAVQADGSEVTTIEGLAPDGEMHPMQAAFRDHHGLQCGFCTPGMVMASVALARDNPDIDDTGIKHGLDGNMCRCTGYQNIVRAVAAGARAMRG